MDKLSVFKHGYSSKPVQYLETVEVKAGVICDVYKFTNDDLRDLGIIRVDAGYATPLQKVLKGTKTIEGYVRGSGRLTVSDDRGTIFYDFSAETIGNEVEVFVGQTMQWTAKDDLTFYEICEPPFEEGRFQDID